MNLRDGGASEKQFEVAARHLAEAMAEVERLRLHVRARQDRIEHLEAIVANADNLQAAVNAAWECRDAWGTYFTASLPMLKMWDALDRCPRRSSTSTFSPDEGEPQVDEIVCPACGGNGLMCEQMVCVKQAESEQAVNVKAEHDRCLRAVFRVLGFTYADDGADQLAYLAKAVADRVRDARREAPSMRPQWEQDLLTRACEQLVQKDGTGPARASSGVHLAILAEPFLGLLLRGIKTIESRFSVNRCAPWGCVRIGDVVLVKGVGWPVVGAFHVSSLASFDIRTKALASIREQFAEGICATDQAFWDSKAKSRYVTLMGVGRVTVLAPIQVTKTDRRGWVVLRGSLGGLDGMD
jgi:hypothetical protein